MKKNAFSVGSFFITLLLCLLALMSGLIAAAGASVFRKTAEAENSRASVRTCVSYIENKIRGTGLIEGDCEIIEAQERRVLSLSHSGDKATIYIYYSDGWLREYAALAGAEFSSELGEKLIRVSGLEFSEEGGLLSIIASDGGYTLCRDIYLYGGGNA